MKKQMIKRYTWMENTDVYAVHYRARNILIFNAGFVGKTKLYILKN